MTFNETFELVNYDEWRAAVERDLKGGSFERLATTLPDTDEIRPLYTRNDWPGRGELPGQQARVRGFGPLGNRGRAGLIFETSWAGAAPDAVRETLARELAGGAEGVSLTLGKVPTVSELAVMLADVDLGATPVWVTARAGVIEAATAFLSLLEIRGVDRSRAAGAILADPIGDLAATGRSAAGIEADLEALGRLSALVRGQCQRFPSVLVSATPYADAGASAAQELAIACATGIAYLQVLELAGLDPARASARMLFRLSVGTDQFLEIAKLRAARILWNRVLGACGVPAAERAMTVHAVTAARVLSRCAPWINVLRATVGCFSAITGGADWISVAPYDDAAGAFDERGRRMSRNTLLVLREEAHLDRVIDPAGGSGYVETLTERLAERAWSKVQEIARRGGIVAALADGSLRAEVASVEAEAARRVATRRDAITGVSEFADLGEHGVAAGAPVATGGGAAFEPRRRAAPFEALRDASERLLGARGARPRVFVAKLGAAPPGERLAFAAGVFAAGGLEVVTGAAGVDAAGAAEAFRASGAAVAALCGSDGAYAEGAGPFAAALRAAGAPAIVLVGAPGDGAARYRAMGIDHFVHRGSDVLQTLGALVAIATAGAVS